MEKEIEIAGFIAHLLDDQFSLFGKRFGLSVLIDLIPELGDTAIAVISLYLVTLAIRLKMPRSTIFHMLWNIAVNYVIGLLPIIGDAAYIINRANIKNWKMIENWIAAKEPRSKESREVI